MKKSLVALALTAVLALGLCSCGSKNNNASPANASSANDKSYTIGICQIVQHDALDAATKGFMDAVEAAFPGKVKFLNQNASGDIQTCSTIVNGFVSQKVDLILANATAPLQAAAAATNSIPIVGTSVTDYASALEISDWNGTVGGNITGASDLAPLDQQAAMLKELFPDAKNVGLLYCSAEANSEYQVSVISGYLADLGFSCTRFAFTDSNDVASVTQAACDASDVIYIPTDNTAAANTETIANVVLPAKVPVIAGEANLCKGCGIATLSIDYYDLGKISGELAVQILNGADVSTLPVKYAPNVTKMVQTANCEALGIAIPEGYSAIED